MSIYASVLVKSDVDKFFKRLKRHAHKAKWKDEDGFLRTSMGHCPMSFLATTCGLGNFEPGTYARPAQALVICASATSMIISAADDELAKLRERMLKALGLS